MPTIIIANKRNSTREIALRIQHHLQNNIKNLVVHNSVEKIAVPGMSLIDAIPDAASKCDMLIVLIGNDWLTETTWLSNEKDFNYVAITTALANGRKVVPVLLDSTQMPAKNYFAGKFEKFGHLTPVRLHATTFEEDAQALLHQITGAPPAPVAPPSVQVPVKTASPTTPVKAQQPLAIQQPSSSYVQKQEVKTPAAPAPLVQTQSSNIAEQLSTTVNFIVGQTISKTVNLYQLPHLEASIRSQIPAHTPIAILTRDANSEWFNVIYVSTTQQKILGWVLANEIEHLSFQGRPIFVMDIDLNTFEFNTHDEIVEFKNIYQRKLTLPSAIYMALFLIGAISCIIVVSTASQASVIAAFILFVVIALVVLAVIISIKTTPINKQIIALENVRKQKRSTAQVATETTNAAIGKAAGIATLIGTVALIATASKNNNSTNRRY